MAQKKVPNPYGKKGGKLHQNKIQQIIEYLQKKGLKIVREGYFPNKKGKSRFADVTAFDENGELKEIHQVGKQNKNGTPIKRERDAIADIEKLSGKKVHAYNVVIIAILLLISAILLYP